MAEYIERESIKKFPIRKDRCDKEHANEHFIFGIESVLEYVENLPAADVAQVVHGRWIEYPRPHHFKCSECKYTVPYRKAMLCSGKREYHYCPNCGAMMDGGDSDAAD